MEQWWYVMGYNSEEEAVEKEQEKAEKSLSVYLKRRFNPKKLRTASRKVTRKGRQ